jgi:hypothetical protein
MPKLNSRSINVMITCITSSAELPRLLMFHVFWHVTLLRCEHVWQDASWASYFGKTYLQNGRKGQETFISARWHYGLGAGCYRGHGPSPQPVGQSNANIRRGLKVVRRGANFVSVVRELQKLVCAWAKDL